MVVVVDGDIYIGPTSPHKTFIFDLDDTLYANHHDYDESYMVFYHMMREKLGDLKAPLLYGLTEIHVKRDDANIRKFKEEGRPPFGRDRFPTTFRELYIDLCEQAGVEWTEKEAQAAYEVGNLAFNVDRYRQKGLVAGTEGTLQFLENNGDNIIIITKGDQEIQDMKYEALGLNRWFPRENFHVVNDKSPEAFAQYLPNILPNFEGDRLLGKIYHIGNGMKSDVFPAIDAGIKAIYVPCESWWHETKDNGKRKIMKHEKDRFIKFDSISDIVTYYRGL